MSNYDYEDDNEDFEEDTSSNDLVKQLRKANKGKDKELAELRSQFETLNKGQRDRTIKETLESRGVNPKISKFIPQDIDPNDESVSKWLEDNAEVFGLELEQNQSKPITNPTEIAAYKRMTNTADLGASPENSADLMQRILNTKTKEELDDLIRNNPGL